MAEGTKARRHGGTKAEGTDVRRRRGGFTIIELIAVLLIIAVMAAVAVPALQNTGDSRGQIAARELLHDMTFARQRAIATGTPTWLVFNTGAKTWSLLGEDPGNPGRVNATLLTDPSTGLNFVKTLDTGARAGINFTSVNFDGDVEVGFDWLGRPLNAAENALAAQGSVVLNTSYQVTVEVGTGHVTYTGP